MREKKNKLRVIKVQNHKANIFRANSRTQVSLIQILCSLLHHSALMKRLAKFTLLTGKISSYNTNTSVDKPKLDCKKKKKIEGTISILFSTPKLQAGKYQTGNIRDMGCV